MAEDALIISHLIVFMRFLADYPNNHKHAHYFHRDLDQSLGFTFLMCHVFDSLLCCVFVLSSEWTLPVCVSTYYSHICQCFEIAFIFKFQVFLFLILVILCFYHLSSSPFIILFISISFIIFNDASFSFCKLTFICKGNISNFHLCSFKFRFVF